MPAADWGDERDIVLVKFVSTIVRRPTRTERRRLIL